MDIVSNSLSETKRIAAEIANQVQPGDVLALYGDLGSGKTTFTRFFAQILGYSEPVTSPTFVVVKNYPLKKPFRGIDEIVHADSYRTRDIQSIGLDEYFERDNCIILIEWPAMIEKFLPARTKKIHFYFLDEEKRRLVSEDFK